MQNNFVTQLHLISDSAKPQKMTEFSAQSQIMFK